MDIIQPIWQRLGPGQVGGSLSQKSVCIDFVIVDITNPKSAPFELPATVPLIREGEEPFAMFRDLIGKFDWMLGPVIAHPCFQVLIQNFHVLPAEACKFNL